MLTCITDGESKSMLMCITDNELNIAYDKMLTCIAMTANEIDDETLLTSITRCFSFSLFVGCECVKRNGTTIMNDESLTAALNSHKHVYFLFKQHFNEN